MYWFTSCSTDVTEHLLFCYESWSLRDDLRPTILGLEVHLERRIRHKVSWKGLCAEVGEDSPHKAGYVYLIASRTQVLDLQDTALKELNLMRLCDDLPMSITTPLTLLLRIQPKQLLCELPICVSQRSSKTKRSALSFYVERCCCSSLRPRAQQRGCPRCR